MEVITIPAKKQEQKILRVAAYARVSADKDAAFHSLEAQQDYYDAYVAVHKDWQLIGIYSDKAISGTKADRPEFQRLLKDCREHKIDLVVTKSITRFARNTVVLLETVRELKTLGIDCYFEKENMHSISPDGELMLTLLAMYAEEEARSASENQCWRIKRKFEQGRPTKDRMLGYRLKDGKYETVPEEAEIVRKIYNDFLSGKSMHSIAKELTAAGIKPRYSDVWNNGAIHNILSNITYTGSLILQKTYCKDFRAKKRALNRSEVPKYQVAGTHEGIISEEDFNRVQEMLAKNRERWKTERDKLSPDKRMFTGLLKCGHCGWNYQYHLRNARNKQYIRWMCQKYCVSGKAACPSKVIPEDILIEKTEEALNLTSTDELSRELLLELLDKIVVFDTQLDFYLKTGEAKSVSWHPRTRKESWTPEMRQDARKRAIENDQAQYLKASLSNQSQRKEES